jgi:hypothetical protein
MVRRQMLRVGAKNGEHEPRHHRRSLTRGSPLATSFHTRYGRGRFVKTRRGDALSPLRT